MIARHKRNIATYEAILKSDERGALLNCAVCGNKADPLPRTFDGDGFRCASCGDYGISGTVPALEKWKNLGPSQRLEALANAKKQAKPGKLPIITSYSF
jgi:hypothetical protein